MQKVNTPIDGVLMLEPRVFGDERGFFFESFNARLFEELTGHRWGFVQDNHSRSAKGVLRGLHYQVRQPQGKLVRVVLGEVYDVAVDLRRSSSTFGRSFGHRLSAENKLQLWIPPGFAHGFVVLSEFERCMAWNDPDLAIDWPLDGTTPVVSKKDAGGLAFRDAEVFP